MQEYKFERYSVGKRLPEYPHKSGGSKRYKLSYSGNGQVKRKSAYHCTN